MGKQLCRYLQRRGFEVMEGSGHRLVEEEVIIEIVQKDGAYIVRTEICVRFSAPRIKYRFLQVEADVLSYVKDVLCEGDSI